MGELSRIFPKNFRLQRIVRAASGGKIAIYLNSPIHAAVGGMNNYY